MIAQGKIQSVETYPAGDKVTQDYPSGTTTITLEKLYEFNDVDGSVKIAGNVYAYTFDPITGIMNITPGLVGAIEESEDVLLWPLAEEKRALIQTYDDDDAVMAVVPHALADELDTGIREEGEQESVLIEEVRGSWTVKEIVYEQPLTGLILEQVKADAEAAAAIAAAASGAADAALAAANGKNTIWHSETPPTTEPNVVGDTWFVHAPAAEGGAIIAQYTGTGGTTWVQTTISHQVISSIDLGVATVGRLAANYIDTGVLSAALTLTGYILAGMPTGARVVIDADGIRQYDSDGNIVINLPTDPDIPSQFEGTGIFSALTVKDNLSIQGLLGEIARGAVLSVASGTSAPAAPSLAVAYETYDTGRFGTGSLFIQTGTHCDISNSPDVLGAATFYGYGKIFGRTNKWWVGSEYTDSSGSKRTRYGNIGSATVVAVGGAERIVINSIYTSGNGAAPVGRLTSLDPSPMTSSGTVAPTQMVAIGARMDDYIFYWRLGRVLGGLSGTQFPDRVAVALYNYQSPNVVVGQITLRQYQVTDSAITVVGGTGADLVVADPLAEGESLIGVTHGRSDKLKMTASGTDYVWLLHGSVKTYAYNTSGVRVPDYDFPTPAGAARMMAHGDVVSNGFVGFRTTSWSDNSPLTKLTNNHWLGSTSGKWWLSISNFDSDVTGGTHETAQGKRASINVPKRAGVRVTIPQYPDRPFPTTTDDPLSAKLYLGRGNADPGRTYMEYVTQLNTPNRTVYVGDFTFPASTAAVPPPVASNFPNSSPGRIQSADGVGWVLAGDGKATLAGVEFDSTKLGFKSTQMRMQDSGYAGSAQSTTSTTLVQHPNGPTLTMIAPPSGVIAISAKVFGKISTSPYFMFASVLCRTSNISGTLVDTQRVFDNYNDWVRAEGLALFSGLTPGATYFFYLGFATSNASGTASISQSRLIGTPSP